MRTRYVFGLPFVMVKMVSEEVEFLVDTGFNGALLMPSEKIRELKLKPIAAAQYALADGSLADALVFEGEIEWMTHKKRVSVVRGCSDFTLLGMELLKDFRTILEPKKGLVLIE